MKLLVREQFYAFQKLLKYVLYNIMVFNIFTILYYDIIYAFKNHGLVFKLFKMNNVYVLIYQTTKAEVYNIELTDGWYNVQGLVDFEMNMLLHKGIVKVGTKLMIHNAELIGTKEGINPLNVRIFN